MGIYMADITIDPILNENDLKAEAELLYDLCDRIADFSDEVAAEMLHKASNGAVALDKAHALTRCAFDWYDENYEGYECIVELTNRARTTGVLSEVK